MPLTIAVDGPVGAGKSTISDAVADSLGILHLDTGAMYRAFALGVIKNGVRPGDEDDIIRLIDSNTIRIDVQYSDNRQVTLLDGENVNDRIRTQEIGEAASIVSSYPSVRSEMVRLQQGLARKCPMLLDGRDIGTVVLPDATVKIYLTASDEVRAQRRMSQLQNTDGQMTFEQVLSEVRARDERDMNRKTDPLRRAEDAILVDSTELSFDQTVQMILDIVREHADS